MTAVLILSACNYRPEEPARLTVATFWGGGGAEVLSRELISVSREFGPVSVDLRFFSLAGLNDYLLRRQSTRNSDNVDIAIIPNDWLGQLIERGIITELPTSRVEALREMVFRQALLAVSDRDNVLAFPISAEVLALVYNPQRFPSPPATMEELLSAPLPPGVLPFALDLLNSQYLAPFVASFQGSLIDVEGSFLWREESMNRALRRLGPAWSDPRGWLACTRETHESLQLQLFAEGKLASFVAGPWLLPALEQSGRPFRVVPIPPFADSTYPARALVGYQCLAVLRTSRWIDLGLELGERLLDSHVNERLNRGTQRLPVLTGAYKSESALASSGTVGFWRALEEGQPLPAAATWSEGFQKTTNRLQRLRTVTQPPTSDELLAVLSGSVR